MPPEFGTPHHATIPVRSVDPRGHTRRFVHCKYWPARGRRANGIDRNPQGRGHQVHLRQEQDLSRHGARLLGLRAAAVRPGQAGLPARQSGRRPVQRAGRLRRTDPQEGNAGHDRRLRHARPGQGRLATGARPLQPQLRVRRTGRRLRPVPARGAAARSRDRKPRPTAGRSASRTTATIARSAAPAAARSAPSRRLGSGPTPFVACSAPSAPTSACAAATSTRH